MTAQRHERSPAVDRVDEVNPQIAGHALWAFFVRKLPLQLARRFFHGHLADKLRTHALACKRAGQRSCNTNAVDRAAMLAAFDLRSLNRVKRDVAI